MAFQPHGSFSEFSSSQETWTAYVERLEQYLAANKVEDADQQRAILLSVCGPATYRLICSLVSPKKPAEFKFKEITEIVQKHHDPKPSVIVQRYRFNTRHRHVGESVSTYVAELRHLSNHCDFGPSLQQMLRDRLVCGIEDPKIQRRLLAEPDLTFDKAFELALASESADKNAKDKNAKDLQATKSPQTSLNRMQTRQAKPCYRCGGNHKATDCSHKSSDCHKCGKKGHLARVCKSKNPAKKEPHPRQGATHSRATHMLTEDTDEYSMYSLTGSSAQPLVVTVKVNNVDLKMELDTGASVSIISEATYNHLWPQAQAPACLTRISCEIKNLHWRTGGHKGSDRCDSSVQ